MTPNPKRNLLQSMAFAILHWKGLRPMLMSSDFIAMAALHGATLVFAFFYGLNPWQVLMAWWVDSVALGVFNVIRMLALPMGGPTAGSRPPGTGPVATWVTRIFLTGFFMVHYGGFQAIYGMILNGPVRQWFHAHEPIHWPGLLIVIGALVAHRTWNFFRDLKKPKWVDLPPGMEFALSMFSPYARVVPMHLVLLFGGIFFHTGLSGAMAVGVFVFFFLIRFLGGTFRIALGQMLKDIRENAGGPKPGFDGEGPWTLVQRRGSKWTRRPYGDLAEARSAAKSVSVDPVDNGATSKTAVSIQDRHGREVWIG